MLLARYAWFSSLHCTCVILYYYVVTAAEVSVCPGQQLNLTCLAAPNQTLLRWSFMLPGRSQPESRYISSRGMVDRVTPRTVGQTEFQFLRTSTSPLMSVIVITSLTAELTGTRVDCSSGDSVMAMFIINIPEGGN